MTSEKKEFTKAFFSASVTNVCEIMSDSQCQLFNGGGPQVHLFLDPQLYFRFPHGIFFFLPYTGFSWSGSSVFPQWLQFTFSQL